ncbi:predicted protein [Chaetomium globosum CBS 148.51]|uniref:Uncharacterized protein n=1 Tax=Chaetomium globosum (strain ATCC 6205 / CBS 148.51 / DSM 1962 / NBRC 6347 / NRRL 1970) TaxID=306901 RepID=Q2HGU9_CHAGB|nr:uncharacterized protein CHGG_00555 [Chaetomium globosum CBS 148.51]EAQ92320.1 predicted protein [Chaetomium globosum CBS 148.51]
MSAGRGKVPINSLPGTNTDPGSQYADPEGVPHGVLLAMPLGFPQPTRGHSLSWRTIGGGKRRVQQASAGGGGPLSERYAVTNKLLPMNENGIVRSTPAARNRGKWAYRGSDSAI